MKVILRAVLLVVPLLLIACSSGTDEAPIEEPSDTAANVVTGAAQQHNRKNADGIDTVTFRITDSTVSLRATGFPAPSGRVVNVMVTGLDSRLGDPMGHADANHVLRFFLDSGCVEIISIPRDTYFDAGFDDTTNLNKLTNVRANRGRAAYHAAVCEIAGLSRIDYWVEFGFSQAMGLLELMGHRDNAQSTLRVLRSRQAYSAGDFQRVYNQGQFIRQTMLRVFDQTDNMVGELAMRAALAIVETNMSYDACDGLLNALRQKGFSPEDPSRIWVRMKPAIYSSLKVYSFDAENVAEIDRQISHKISKLGLDSVSVTSASYENRLSNLIQRAAADSAKSAASVVRLLKRPYDQRAWLQVTNIERRIAYRNRLCTLLASSYRRLKNPNAAQAIENYIELENKVNANR